VFFLEYVSAQGFAQSAPVTYEKGKLFLGRGAGPAPAGPPPEQGVMAIEASTGNIVWKYAMSRVGLGSGLVATKGGLVFVAGAGGEFIALDQKNGKALWHFRTNGPINTSPMAYAVDGKQHVALVAGNAVYAFALPDQ
jgi:outer membrane protein assembly factor BamB